MTCHWPGEIKVLDHCGETLQGQSQNLRRQDGRNGGFGATSVRREVAVWPGAVIAARFDRRVRAQVVCACSSTQSGSTTGIPTPGPESLLSPS